MDENEVAGMAQRAAGKVQDAAGGLMGDTRTQAEGKARQAYGTAQQAYGQVRDNAGEGIGMLQDQVRDYPIASLLLAGAIGWLIGRLSS